MNKKLIDIQILQEEDEVVSTVCIKDTITITVKKKDGSFKVYLAEKNDNGLFKLNLNYEIVITNEQETPTIKTSSLKQGDKDPIRVYTL